MQCPRPCWRSLVRFSELEGASVGVWGAGREIGSFAAQLTRRLPSARIAVAAFDAPPAGDVRTALGAPDAIVAVGADALGALRGCDLVVRSPGVSIYRPELRALREEGVPIVTATGLWLAERGGAGVIGVSGTKGKSTTAALASKLAQAAGLEVQLAGNIGAPALDLLDAPPADVTILELSSYQIADLTCGPQVALLTNLFREHADWHGSEQRYRADKLRLLGLEGVRSVVLNGRDPLLAALDSDTEVTLYGVPGGWDVTATGVTLRGERQLALAELPLPGAHNALNLCAALAALEALGVTPPPLAGALAGFSGLAHRLETVCERDGVLWVEDSISTTPESALAALASFPGRGLVLIAGGQDRGQDYSGLARAIGDAGATVIGVPSTGARLIDAAREAGVAEGRAIEVADLTAAVALARGLAVEGDVILLSPAAPSYDHYRDFEQRGERFRALAEGAGEHA
jgi:UDP-N-acetylmuramoyl-L-alanine---L-glutamate ligase